MIEGLFGLAFIAAIVAITVKVVRSIDAGKAAAANQQVREHVDKIKKDVSALDRDELLNRVRATTDSADSG